MRQRSRPCKFISRFSSPFLRFFTRQANISHSKSHLLHHCCAHRQTEQRMKDKMLLRIRYAMMMAAMQQKSSCTNPWRAARRAAHTFMTRYAYIQDASIQRTPMQQTLSRPSLRAMCMHRRWIKNTPIYNDMKPAPRVISLRPPHSTSSNGCTMPWLFQSICILRVLKDFVL